MRSRSRCAHLLDRRLIVLAVALAAVLLIATVTASAASASDEFTFDGSGWGHGVGMSQYGARAMAEDGRSAGQILGHYYAGSSVGNVPSGTARPWIGLLQNRTSAGFRTVSGTTTAWDANGGKFTIPKDETWTFRNVSGGQCQWRSPDGYVGSPGKCRASVTSSGRVTVTNKSRTYKLGSNTGLRVRPLPKDATRFHVSLEIPLERYIYGIAEMPAAWHMEALKAQAITARGYAVYRLLAVGSASGFSDARKNSCWCHLVDSTGDQVYVGWTRESVSQWRQAVDETKSRVVTHPDAPRHDVAQTFYYSSSGGRTENSEDVWSTAVSYLRSVSDPWSLDSRAKNPNASWLHDVASKTVASKVGLDSVSRIEVTDRYRSGSVARVAFHGHKDGKSTTITRSGTWLRKNFTLKSRWVWRIFLPPFWDDDGSVHEQQIVRIYEAGITKGCNPPDNDRFCPKDGVSREQMAAFIVRAMGLTDEGTKRFKDVEPGSTFEKDINRLAEAGITKGCNPPTNDRFCPKDIVTRQQMAAFLARALELTDEGSKRFKDVEPGSTFEKDINRIAEAGITKGCNPPTNDRFCPTHDTSREQMASFLARAFLP